jgi:hypothetical protein
VFSLVDGYCTEVQRTLAASVLGTVLRFRGHLLLPSSPYLSAKLYCTYQKAVILITVHVCL